MAQQGDQHVYPVVRDLAPSPHYPDWRYVCVIGMHGWDSPIKHASAWRTCPQHGGSK